MNGPHSRRTQDPISIPHLYSTQYTPTMARAIEPSTWKNGFQQPSTGEPWNTLDHVYTNGTVQPSHYVTPPSVELLTSTKHNSLGLSVQRCWPTLYDGTNSPHGLPEWYERRKEVDVVICGGVLCVALRNWTVGLLPNWRTVAGPSGLEVALSLVRQGVSFRIVGRCCLTFRYLDSSQSLRRSLTYIK